MFDPKEYADKAKAVMDFALLLSFGKEAIYAPVKDYEGAWELRADTITRDTANPIFPKPLYHQKTLAQRLGAREDKVLSCAINY